MRETLELKHYNAENYIQHSVSSPLPYPLYLIVFRCGISDLIGQQAKQSLSLYLGAHDNNKHKPDRHNVVADLTWR